MYDIAINGGTVIDTVHKEQKILNIGIRQDKIAYVGPCKINAKKNIDASGKLVSPGFIDVHGHIDGHLYSGELAACQGITTTIGGNCGLSPIDMRDFFKVQNKDGFYINQAEFVGHSFSLRRHVGLTDPYEKADAGQIKRMSHLARKALDNGACGISFGLDYSPGASLQELYELCSVASEYNKMVAVHTRLFTDKDLNSLYEMLAVAKETKIRLLLSHFVYQYGNGCMADALRIVDEARAQGIEVFIDSGMYKDWTTYIGTETYNEDTIRDNGYVYGDFIVATGKFTGRRMTKQMYDIMRRDYPDDSVICFTGRKEEIYMALERDYAVPSTDIGAYKKGEGHPQIAGTFPKYFIEMVRDNAYLTLEEAVYKATLLPAQLFHIKGRGIIEPDAYADMVIFKLEDLKDNADFPHLGRPDGKPGGIDYVIVNGRCIVDEGCFTGRKNGQVLPFIDEIKLNVNGEKHHHERSYIRVKRYS